MRMVSKGKGLLRKPYGTHPIGALVSNLLQMLQHTETAGIAAAWLMVCLLAVALLRAAVRLLDEAADVYERRLKSRRSRRQAD
jgi:hypothetical protein